MVAGSPSLYFNTAPHLKGKEILLASTILGRLWPCLGYMSLPDQALYQRDRVFWLACLHYTPTSGSGDPKYQDWHPYGATWIREKWLIPQRKVCWATNNLCLQQANSFLWGNPKNPPGRIETVPAMEFGTYADNIPNPPDLSHLIAKVAQALFREPRNHTKAWRKKVFFYMLTFIFPVTLKCVTHVCVYIFKNNNVII